MRVLPRHVPHLLSSRGLSSVKPLWDHQREAISLVNGQAGSLLDMEMGTGKTRVALEVLDQERRRSAFEKPALILAPKNVLNVWKAEMERYAPALCNFLLELPSGGQAMAEALAERNRGLPFILLLNYEMIPNKWMGYALLKQPAWSVLVCDESHRLKAPGGATSRRVRAIAGRSDRRLLMTGTPIPHSPLDIYAQMKILDSKWEPRTVDKFKQRYAHFGDRHIPQRITGWQNLGDLQKRIAPYKYSVSLDQVMDLPAGTTEVVHTILSPSARKAYDELKEEFVTQIASGEISTFNVLTRTLRLQQMTSGTFDIDGERHVIDDGKEEMLRQIFRSSERPVVVFTRFRADLDTVHRAAAHVGHESAELSGRAKDLEKWQDAEDQPRVVAVQMQAGGLGVDMTRADRCIFYNTGYSAGDYWQCRARVRRAGQTRTTQFIHLIAKDTVDEVAYQAILDRTNVGAALMRSMT